MQTENKSVIDVSHDEAVMSNPLNTLADANGKPVIAHRVGEPLALSPEDKVIQKRVNRRFDMTILPLLALMNFLSSMDKGNLGNAQTAGLTNDLGIPATTINDAVSFYYVTFLIFQPLNGWIAFRVGPQRWLGVLMTCWGICVLCNAFAATYGQIIAIRLLIGLFESGFASICIFYLSQFYTRFDIAKRIGIFFALSAVSGAFSGAIAYGLLTVTGLLRSWQYLFIVEGTLTAILAIICGLALPSKPSTAWMLSKADREFVARRELVENPQRQPVRATKTDVKETLRDYKLWLILPFSIVAAIPIATFPVFLPIVLKGFGYSGNMANLMSVPPTLFGVMGLLLTTWSSDRFHDRGLHIVGTLSVTLLGSILVVTITDNVGRYCSLCVLLLGSFAVTPLTAAWLAGNTPVPGKRVLVLGCSGWGYTSGILGSQIFQPRYAPRYLTPFYIVLALNIVAIIGYTGYQFNLRRINRWRARRIENWSAAQIEEEEMGSERLGDKKWTYKYQI